MNQESPSLMVLKCVCGTVLHTLNIDDKETGKM